MGYIPLAVAFRKNRLSLPQPTGTTTMFVNPSLDLKDMPQLMTPQQALQIVNYLPTSDARLPTRKGLKKIFEVAGGHPITLLQQFTTDIWIFGYNTTTAAYTISTNTVTNIKTDWPTNAAQSGVRYGDYFFVCNGSDIIQRIDNALTITPVTGSPMATVLFVNGPRLYANTANIGEVAYSDVDTGANPPFTNWTVGPNADNPGLVTYRNAGVVTAINALGNNIVVGAKEGKWAFTTTIQTVGSTSEKVDVTILERIDMGMARATIVIPKGMFYVNSGGMWQLQSLGQSNIAFSEQEGEASLILGVTYFNNIDLTNADFAYDARIDTIFLTCARNSDVNNLVIAYNVSSGTYAEFSGWKINRFMNIDQIIYGAGAAETKVWQCFEGYDDDGADIWTTFEQELKLGSLETRQELSNFYIDAFLSPSSNLKICCSIYTPQGNYVADKLCYMFTATSGTSSAGGYGVSGWGSSGFGGHNSNPNGNMIESFDGFGAGHIRNFQRIRVKITQHSKVPHVLVWIKASAIPKVPIRRRQMKILT